MMKRKIVCVLLLFCLFLSSCGYQDGKTDDSVVLAGDLSKEDLKQESYIEEEDNIQERKRILASVNDNSDYDVNNLCIRPKRKDFPSYDCDLSSTWDDVTLSGFSDISVLISKPASYENWTPEDDCIDGGVDGCPIKKIGEISALDKTWRVYQETKDGRVRSLICANGRDYISFDVRFTKGITKENADASLAQQFLSEI